MFLESTVRIMYLHKCSGHEKTWKTEKSTARSGLELVDEDADETGVVRGHKDFTADTGRRVTVIVVDVLEL